MKCTAKPLEDNESALRREKSGKQYQVECEHFSIMQRATFFGIRRGRPGKQKKGMNREIAYTSEGFVSNSMKIL